VTRSGAPQIVINADDLGSRQSVNRAILLSFKQELISSASIMANMPAFEEALEIVSATSLKDRIGVHLNLTEGAPISETIKLEWRFCGTTGQFNPRGRSLWSLTAAEHAAVEAEYSAQIEAVIAGGIRPSHLDSHQHFHTQWPIPPILFRLARRYEISAIRLSRNCGPSPGAARRAYKWALNARIIHSGLAPTRHFGNAADVASLSSYVGPVEVMVHPDLDREGRLVDVVSGGGTNGAVLLEPIAAHWRQVGSIVSFTDLRTAGSPDRPR
jgi:chitin disaccharide deacetylase